MQYKTTSDSYAGSVLVKNNAWTTDGNWVGNDGKDSRSDYRWLAHANRGKTLGKTNVQDWYTTRSDGCDIVSYANQQALLRKLKYWGMSDGYQIRTHLVNKKYGGK